MFVYYLLAEHSCCLWCVFFARFACFSHKHRVFAKNLSSDHFVCTKSETTNTKMHIHRCLHVDRNSEQSNNDSLFLNCLIQNLSLQKHFTHHVLGFVTHKAQHINCYLVSYCLQLSLFIVRDFPLG